MHADRLCAIVAGAYPAARTRLPVVGFTDPAGNPPSRRRCRCGLRADRSQPTIAAASASVACSHPTSTVHSTRNQRSRSYA
ncbi:hypothetical protein ABZS79_32525 [Streptomyces griseoloalbus]|uniref:hypothetical protein n=1 Tax=Streptomyces griseoloalbus TaxID=67303 RepID=UPI0033BB2625